MNRPCLLLICAMMLFAVGPSSTAAPRTFEPACELTIHEERVELENARLEVELAGSNFAAFEKIFDLIDRLWKADATERMRFLRAKFDRDAARLALERADLLLERQQALVDHYRKICGVEDDAKCEAKASESLEQIRARYRLADCDQQAKAIEVAEVNLEFNEEWLASVNDLRAGDVATIQDVIQAELDVTLEQQRLADARARTTSCRARLGPADGEGTALNR